MSVAGSPNRHGNLIIGSATTDMSDRHALLPELPSCTNQGAPGPSFPVRSRRSEMRCRGRGCGVDHRQTEGELALLVNKPNCPSVPNRSLPPKAFEGWARLSDLQTGRLLSVVKLFLETNEGSQGPARAGCQRGEQAFEFHSHSMWAAGGC
jgi:hypothetical protein